MFLGRWTILKEEGEKKGRKGILAWLIRIWHNSKLVL